MAQYGIVAECLERGTPHRELHYSREISVYRSATVRMNTEQARSEYTQYHHECNHFRVQIFALEDISVEEAKIRRGTILYRAGMPGYLDSALICMNCGWYSSHGGYSLDGLWFCFEPECIEKRLRETARVLREMWQEHQAGQLCRFIYAEPLGHFCQNLVIDEDEQYCQLHLQTQCDCCSRVASQEVMTDNGSEPRVLCEIHASLYPLPLPSQKVRP